MRVKSRLKNMVIRGLTQSMDVKTMTHVARRLIDNYDVHERSGFPGSVPIPNQEAARQIVEDMIEHQQFLAFISLLIDVNRSGFVGRKYRIPRMKDILLEVMEAGYSFDTEQRVFVENAGQRRTRNWGVLLGGQRYTLAFLIMDIVKNSELVRTYDQETISRLYRDVRKLMQRVVEKRDGRLWLWEGDGGLAAFYMGDTNIAAVHSGMEILHELFLYNHLWSSLDEHVAVRLSVHSGQVEYREQLDSIESPVLEKARHIEARIAGPNELAISELVYDTVDPLVARWFRENAVADESYYRYALEFAE
jgi:class 3 adenylate cyclase